METWEIDFEWLKVRHFVKEALKLEALPEMNAILLMVGIQELGRWQKQYTKEQKQDLMHIAICHLLSYEGYYEFTGRDADGWPHYKHTAKVQVTGVKEQEEMLRVLVIRYFKEYEQNA